MPDDCADIEKEFLARLKEHQERLETDPEYRKQWEDKKESQSIMFPVGAW